MKYEHKQKLIFIILHKYTDIDQKNIMDLISLLRSKSVRVEYDIKYNPNWPDEELLSHIDFLDCSNTAIKNIMSIPNCKRLHANNCPNLTSISDLPKCKTLDCCNCLNLININNLPYCNSLHCHGCKLSYLPELPRCTYLECRTFDHIELYYYIHIIQPYDLPFYNLDEWKIIWKTKKCYLGTKYGRLWYQNMLKSKAKQKVDIFLEMKYSPDQKFYKEDEYYKHFKENQK